MKIKSIEIENYRAFHGKFKINVDAKNLLVYGENGSGKSSLFQAISDFFCSSDGDNEIDFIKNKWNTSNPQINEIKIIFSDENSFSFKPGIPAPQTPQFILEIAKQKPFYSYKRLLKTYLLEGQKIEKRIYYLLVEDILAHYFDRTHHKTIQQYWKDFKSLNKFGKITEEDKEKQSQILTFNAVLKAEVEKLTNKNNYLLETYFKNSLTISIEPPVLTSTATKVKALREEVEKQLSEKEANIIVKLYGNNIPEYNHFLNEARLSSLAISLYLSSLLTIPAPEGYKILFLDDIFIGLDAGNRLPLLKILQKEFSDWQIFITTYDRHWFELAKHSLSSWGKAEMYVGKNEGDDFETPIYIANSDTPFEKAVKYFNKANISEEFIDYPAAGNYLRKVCENLLKDKLYGKYRIKIKGDTDEVLLKDEITELFESFVKMLNDLGLDSTPLGNYPIIIKSVLNPLSHGNLDKPIYKYEVEEAFKLIAKIEEVKKEVIIPQGEKLILEKGTRQIFLRIENSDFLRYKQNGNIGLSNIILQPMDLIQNGRSRSQRMYKQTSLEKAYDSVCYAELNIQNASSTVQDIYSEYKLASDGQSLRQKLDSL